jgi:hypothetical protein
MRPIKKIGERKIDQRHLDAARELEWFAKQNRSWAQSWRKASKKANDYEHGRSVAYALVAGTLARRARVIRNAARARGSR